VPDISDISPKKSFSKTLLVPYILIVLLMVCAIVLHFQVVTVQKSDNVRINLAGRQRMLTQKLSKEILQYSKNIAQKEEIEQTVLIFETTLLALTRGGDAPLDLNAQTHVHLPQMEDATTRRQLLKVNEGWQVLKANIVVFTDTRDPVAFNYIMLNNMMILEEMDKAVFMMQHTAEGNNRRVNTILYVAYFAIILILTFLLGSKFYQLRHATVYIDRLESILPICSNCKKIREPDAQSKKQASWTAIESYIEDRSEAKFSHGLCPECIKELYGDEQWFKDQQE